jgi:serine/threonine protein kinase
MTQTRETLAARLRRGPLSVREATQICRALLSVLEQAHARGTAFGAISPDTILLEDGRPSLTGAASIPGAQPAADLYALAVVTYRAMTGRAWTPGADPASADWSGIPRRVRRAFRKAFATSPADRWPDASAFQRALWVPRPRHTVWPALVILVLAAVVVTAIVFCKPLGLCWERPGGAVQQVEPN